MIAGDRAREGERRGSRGVEGAGQGRAAVDYQGDGPGRCAAAGADIDADHAVGVVGHIGGGNRRDGRESRGLRANGDRGGASGPEAVGPPGKISHVGEVRLRAWSGVQLAVIVLELAAAAKAVNVMPEGALRAWSLP